MLTVNQSLVAFDALSHNTRFKIFRMLVKAGSIGLSAEDLSKKNKISAATLSFHMSKLINAEIVVSKKQGRKIHYFTDYKMLSNLLNNMTDSCCINTNEKCENLFLRKA